MRLVEFYTEQKKCSYIESELNSFRYFYIKDVSASFYHGLLQRGWRRFGNSFFVPVCRNCTKCISIRTPIDSFEFSKNHKRVLKKASNIDIYIQKPSITQAHIALYNKYHLYMKDKKGWDFSIMDIDCYMETFIEGYRDFGYEMLFVLDSKLIGVGLVDVVKDCITAIYFYYDHDYSHFSLGTLNILKQIELGKNLKLTYFYPGYWIQNHYCMGYKERFKPFEALKNQPDIFDVPQWKLWESSEL